MCVSFVIQSVVTAFYLLIVGILCELFCVGGGGLGVFTFDPASHLSNNIVGDLTTGFFDELTRLETLFVFCTVLLSLAHE